MRKHYSIALLCATILLTACSDSKPTEVLETVEATTQVVGDPDVEIVPVTPTISIGKNELDSVELEEEMGGLFRLTKSTPQVSIDFELNFGNITGYKQTNVYITLYSEGDVNQLVASEPMLKGVSTLLTQGTGVFYTQLENPAIEGFDPSKSQTENYESICAAYGVSYIGEEDLDSVPPTVLDYIAIDTSNLNINVGDTAQTNLLHIPEGYTLDNIVYFTTDTTVASVDEHGLVTGRKMGSVTLKAQTSDGMHSAQTIVNVLDPSLTVLEPDDPA